MNKAEFSTLENRLFPKTKEISGRWDLEIDTCSEFMNKHMLLNKRPRNNFALCFQERLAASKLFAGNGPWHMCLAMLFGNG